MFDIIVIGGGPAGYRTAQLLGTRGHTVAIIEKSNIGGVCLNQGCIPFKTYLHASRIMQEANKYNQDGIIIGSKNDLNQASLLEKKEKVVKGLRQGVLTGLQNKSVTFIYGEAYYSGRNGNNYLFEVNGEIVEASKLVIAIGSVEIELPDIDRDNNKIKIITSKDMLELTETPKSIAIIGAGAIGLEAACFFREAGSEVTIIEAEPYVGGKIDCEIANALEKILNRKGIRIYTNTIFKKIKDGNIYIEKTDGTMMSIQTEYLLISVGRKPNIESRIINEINICFDENGIKIDDKCRTTDGNIFACGDVTGKLMLAHTAYHQAKIIADTISGIENSTNYKIIPRVIYTNPEVLSVGMTEQECKDAGIEFQSRSLPMTFSGKYFADYGKDGAKAKMIIDKNRHVIGFHMIGNNSSEISLAVEMMIAYEMKIEDICDLVYAHPSYAEIIGDLAESFI